MKYQFSNAGSHQSDEATPALEIFGGEVAGADSATSSSDPRRMKGGRHAAQKINSSYWIGT